MTLKSYSPDFADRPEAAEEWARGNLEGDVEDVPNLPFINDLQVLIWATETGPRLLPRQFALLVAMSKLYRRDQEWLTINQGQLADMANFASKDAVCKTMRELKALDLVHVKGRFRDNLRKESEYRLAGFLHGWRPFDKTEATSNPLLDRLEEAKDEIADLKRRLVAYEGDMPVEHREEDDTSLSTYPESNEEEEGTTPVMPSQHNGDSTQAQWVHDTLVEHPELFRGFNGGFNAAKAYFIRNPLQLTNQLQGLEIQADAQEKAGTSVKAQRTRATEITPEFVEKMVEQYPELEVQSEIEDAMNHTARQKAIDLQQYVRTWLRKSENWRKERAARNQGAQRPQVESDHTKYDFWEGVDR